MTGPTEDGQEDPRGLAELSALADGTLEPSRRAEVQARIDAAPELKRRYVLERQAVTRLSHAREHDRAPAQLRARIEAQRTARPARRSRARPLSGRLAVAGALAAVLIALVLILPSGAPGGPSVSQAAALGARGATMGAPTTLPGHPAQLQTAIGTLHFPDWTSTIGWRATGARQDRIGGRRVLTVYYRRSGRTLAYSIVSGPPLTRPPASSGVRNRYDIQAFRQDGRIVVTWRQDGHTCVLSALGLPEPVLASLVPLA